MNRKSQVISIATAAMIAALYVVLAFVSNAFGLASGAIQVRISEALAILPFFTFAAVPGVTIGCFLFNLLSGAAILDVIFGSVASLIGVLITYFIGRKAKASKALRFLLPVPTILANAMIVPWVLRTAYGLGDAYWYLFATVGIGELISCGILGMILLYTLLPIRRFLFPAE